MKNIENGHSSDEGFTMIPSCNTPFAKVKLRLQTMQLETIFINCPDGNLFRGNCPWGEFYEGNYPGGSCPWRNYSGAIVLGAQTYGKLSWEEFNGK